METSTYDSCLMITEKGNAFGMAALQTDDTLQLGTQEFMDKEEKEMTFTAKPKIIMTEGSVEDFNGCRIKIDNGNIVTTQKGQAEKIRMVDITANDRAQQYVEQRARGAYMASLCQPEAVFDYSAAAQVQQPTDEDYATLNRRLKWQLDNIQRGLTYVPLDPAKWKVMVFTDGSFANNADMTSQIGYIVTLVNETNRTDEEFTFRGNIIHWSSTKCKRVTRSVLASEIYGAAGGVDTGFVVAETIRMVTERLGIVRVPLIICTDSYSLYECLVKLGTTSEKRLMIDIMALRQMYERREIDDIVWINGHDNPADAMTKASPNKALEKLITTNELTVGIEGWVDRKRKRED